MRPQQKPRRRSPVTASPVADNVAAGLGGVAHLGEPIDELAVEPDPGSGRLGLWGDGASAVPSSMAS